ncbi:MAG TPA: sugar phosphate isomerase/epimerase [Gemmatimonadaceae bacterium]|nr:sugar phosphate isomerase/epimerase [Gemmatimonadaceae bacterium]
MKRRELLRQFAVAAGAPLLYDLMQRQVALPSHAKIRFGYAAITWDGNDEQAIVDIASLGFRGIQLRSNTVSKYGDRPAVLRELLEQHRLTLVAFSSGNLSIDPAVEREQLALHTRHAAFVQKLGGLYLQIIDEKPRGRVLIDADYTRLGQLLTELGRRTADLGIPVSYHHHIGSIGEYPDAIRRILDAADPRYVKFQLDTAHFQQGGGDPAQAVKEYGSRLLFLHIKDVEAPVPGGGKDSYRFVELGRGSVDFKRVFDALREIDFSGWAIVELDRVPDPPRTPRESAMISKTYLQETLGFTI